MSAATDTRWQAHMHQQSNDTGRRVIRNQDGALIAVIESGCKKDDAGLLIAAPSLCVCISRKADELRKVAAALRKPFLTEGTINRPDAAEWIERIASEQECAANIARGL